MPLKTVVSGFEFQWGYDKKISIKMNKTEIKKALYKQKPIAKFNCIIGTTLYYNTIILDETNNQYGVSFSIPVEEIGDAVFYKEMDGKLLNRYIVVEETA